MSTFQELHVIFGTGPVGTTLADELLTKGKKVHVINRSGKGQVPSGAELIAGDASKLEVVKHLCQGAAVVYNCTNPPYYQMWPETLPRLQENMIEGAASVGAKLVVIDGLYQYGETHSVPITETTPHTATSRKGRLRGELAWGYLQAHRVGKVRVAIGRAADFFGPHVLNSSLGQNVFPEALSNQPVMLLGNIDLPHSYTYMPDIAKSLAVLGEREEALGREWLLPVAPTVTTRDVLRIVEEKVGHPLQMSIASTVKQAQQLGLFDETLAREYDEMFYQYNEPQIVDSSAIEQTFNLHATPLNDAIGATVRWYQEHTNA